MQIRSERAVREWIATCVKETPIFDMHTHLFAPCFGELLRYGMDETLTYHYLVEETLLVTGMAPREYWDLQKPRQAELIWQTLFVDRTPVSESCRTVLAMLQRDGLDANEKDLDACRAFYAGLSRRQYVEDVFRREQITGVMMTNDPFCPEEARVWLQGGYEGDPRFLPALRIDDLLFYAPAAVEALVKWGYAAERTKDGKPTAAALPEIRRFLEDWLDRTQAQYCAASLPVAFSVEDGSACATILTECVLPVCKARNLPVALMLGVTRRVHPAMLEAGDSLGKADIRQLHKLFLDHRENLFLVTALARENQQELTATARIFNNVLLFGCWWFLNNPVFMEELTRMRYELLGPKFVAQHSDANMLGHLEGKWERFKAVLTRVLAGYYAELLTMGYYPEDSAIREEVADLCGGYYHKFLARAYRA